MVNATCRRERLPETLVSSEVGVAGSLVNSGGSFTDATVLNDAQIAYSSVDGCAIGGSGQDCGLVVQSR